MQKQEQANPFLVLKPRVIGVPKDYKRYRANRRNNNLAWEGVETKYTEQPTLERNTKGQVNFSKKRIEEQKEQNQEQVREQNIRVSETLPGII